MPLIDPQCKQIEMSGKKPCCRLQDFVPNKCPCVPKEIDEENENKRQKISQELEKKLREAFDILDRGQYQEMKNRWNRKKMKSHTNMRIGFSEVRINHDHERYNNEEEPYNEEGCFEDKRW